MIHFHRQIIVDKVKELGAKSVLEVGSGPGDNLFAISAQLSMILPQSKAMRLEGIDKEPNVISKYYAEYILNNVKIVLGDMKDMTYKDGEFDVVLADATLMYIGNEIGQVMEQIKRISGRAIIICDKDINRVKPYLGEPKEIIPIVGWSPDWDKDGYIAVWVKEETPKKPKKTKKTKKK